MRIRSFIVGALAAVVASVLVVSCGDDPPSKLPTSPSLASGASVTIAGPENVAPGESVQFVAQIGLSDGSRKTASANVRWQVEDVSRLQIDASGLATGQAAGETILTVVVTLPDGTLRATRAIVIVPAGTYRLTGIVSDDSERRVRLFGARVEVMPGSLATAADFDGRFRLYGVPADATVRVTAPGWATVEQSLRLTSHATQNFLLIASGPQQDLSGPYTLTIDATGCSGPLAAELRHRAYEVSLTQNGSSIDVRLTEPRFVLDSDGSGNHFTGGVSGSTATFFLEYFYYYYPDLAERLPDGSVLVITGTAVTAVVGGAASGKLGGHLVTYDWAHPGNTRFLTSACSGNHRFTLTPR